MSQMPLETSAGPAAEALENNPLFRSFLEGRPISPADHFPFSCRGCGHLCCTDQTILLTPPEAARIMWFLARTPDVTERVETLYHGEWAEIFPGGSTGMATLRIAFHPKNPKRPQGDRVCPFLALVFGGDPQNPKFLDMGWCTVRGARPGACQIYPLGRVMMLDPNTCGTAVPRVAAQEYRILTRCPGFERPQPGEALPPGYAPAPADQTVLSWSAGQLNAEAEAEKNLYLFRVVGEFIKRGLHAPTPDNPDGRLSDAHAIQLGTDILYNPPPPPADPAEDHRTIMTWLETILDGIEEIERVVNRSLAPRRTAYTWRVRRSPEAITTAIALLREAVGWADVLGCRVVACVPKGNAELLLRVDLATEVAPPPCSNA